MAGAGDRLEQAKALLRAAVSEMAAVVRASRGPSLGEALIQVREAGCDPLEAVFAEGVREFDRSGEYRADGAVSVTNWLRWKCNLSGGAAAERVEVARQLDKLPQTQQAFANGEIGYQHVAVMARTAEHVGAAAVRKAESSLLQAAQTRDPGQFVSVAKDFEQRVDPAGALAEANRAYQRRYVHLGDPRDGLVRLDGLLDVEGGATLRSALGALMPPPKKDDERTAGQRSADALVELARQSIDGSKARTIRDHEATGVRRPHLVITASLDALAGVKGAPAATLDGTPIPAETLQRHACDSAVSRIAALGELEEEQQRASRTIASSTRRALIARDHHCVFPGCDRKPHWCDGHHVVWWTRGGQTKLENLALLCRIHHRLVHEGGWKLLRSDTGEWVAIPPTRRLEARAVG